MAQAYTPGLRVAEFTSLRKDRRLPLLGEVMAVVGATVSHEEVIARTKLPGDVQSINLAHRLSIEASDLSRYMTKGEGDSVEEGEIIAESKSFFGLFTSRCESPITGTIETMSSVTGQLLLRKPPIPVEVTAYVDGIVAEVHPEEGATIETWGTFIQGIFGVGGETNGPIRFVASSPDQIFTDDLVPSDGAGQILVGGGRITMETISKARETGVAGLICAGFDDQDLKLLLGRDLGVAITGQEKLGITLVLTEGFGEIAMADRTFNLLRENDGQRASINGATQIRAGVIRPEIIIPKLDREKPVEGEKHESSGGLTDGTRVRIIREPNFGSIATVTGLPPELHAMECETKVRVLRVKLDSGEEYLLPRANVELIEH